MARARSGSAGEAPSASFLALLALGAAGGMTFSALLSTDHLPTYRDLLFFTWPLKVFLHERLLAGHLPLWNPLLLLGTPYLANLQSGVLYPPSLALLLPLPLGFNVFLLAHYGIALLGSWLWLRGSGFAAAPATIGAAVFALGGYMVSLLNLTNHLQTAVWAPWVLWAWERFRVSGGRGALPLIGALSMQILGASPENLLLTLAVVFASTIWRHAAGSDWRRLGGSLGRLSLACIAAGALCAVQILPTLEYVGQSPRSAALAFESVGTYSFQPVSGLQLLLPHSSALLPPDSGNSLGPSFEGAIALIQSYYLGIVPLCLAIVGLSVGRERLFWGLLIFGGIALALGDHTPLFPKLYEIAPWALGKFRYPEKFYFLVHLGAAVMAAEGARLVNDRDQSSVRLAWAALGTLASVALAVYALRWLWPESFLELVAALRGRYLPPTAYVPLALDTYGKVQRLLLILCALGAILVCGRSLLGAATGGLLLVALTLVDLVSANRNLNPGMSWAALAARRPLIDVTEARAAGGRIYHAEAIDVAATGSTSPQRRLRFWVGTLLAREDLDPQYFEQWDAMASDAGMIHGIPNVSGADGIGRWSDELLLRAMRELPLDRAVKLLRTFGTAYLLGPDLPPIAGLTPIAAERDSAYRAARVLDPLPLVYAVTRLRVEPSPGAALLAMSRDDFEPGREAVVDALPPEWPHAEPGNDAPRVTMLAKDDGLWRFRVEGPRESLAVVNESFFPGWEAAVDGNPAPIARTNGLVRGVAVGAGAHVVELRYRPRSFRIGAAISLVSACSFVLAGSIGQWWSRRRESAPLPYTDHVAT